MKHGWVTLGLLVAGCSSNSQTGDILFRCPSQTSISMELGPKEDTVAIRTGLMELSFFSTSSWERKKCQVRTRRFTYISANKVAVIGEDDRVYLIDPHTGEPQSSFKVPGSPLGPPAVCGQYLCIPVGSQDHFAAPSWVVVMDLQGKVLRKFPTASMSISPAVRELSPSPDGTWLVVLGWDRAVIYRAGTWRKVADLKGGFATKYYGGFLRTCTFSASGKHMYLGNDLHCEIVETVTWKRKTALKDSGHGIVSALPRPGSEEFLLLLSDGSLRASSDTLSVVVPGTDPYGPAGSCIAAAFAPRGVLLTGWENGVVRKKVLKSP